MKKNFSQVVLVMTLALAAVGCENRAGMKPQSAPEAAAEVVVAAPPAPLVGLNSRVYQQHNLGAVTSIRRTFKLELEDCIANYKFNPTQVTSAYCEVQLLASKEGEEWAGGYNQGTTLTSDSGVEVETRISATGIGYMISFVVKTPTPENAGALAIDAARLLMAHAIEQVPNQEVSEVVFVSAI